METHSVTTIKTRTHWIDVAYCSVCRQDVRGLTAELAGDEYGVVADEIRTAVSIGGVHLVNGSTYCSLSLAGHFSRGVQKEGGMLNRLEEIK